MLNFYHLGKKIPDNAVYIGRKQAAHGLEQSVFANPEWLPPGSSEEDRQANLGRYRQHLVKLVQSGKVTTEDLLALENRDVVCFCAPKACHGDVVSEAVAWAVKQRDAALRASGSENAPALAASPPRRPTPGG